MNTNKQTAHAGQMPASQEAAEGDVNSLKDITWGGRIRRNWQDRIWTIACKASVSYESSFSGGMSCSRSTDTHRFLDGAVSDRRGYFDASCGMFWWGDQTRAYILYKLGLDARRLLRLKELPPLEALEAALAAQKEAERVAKKSAE